MTKIEGRCLCGGVSYESETPPQLAVHCHCEDCRRASGTGHGTHVMLSEDGFKVQGEVKFFDKPADSGNVVSRGFCPDCGSAIYSTNSGMPGMVFVRASSLNDLEAISPAMTVYASRAASWDPAAAGLPSYPEMPEGGPDQAVADHG